ncbi:MAG: thioredoxin [Muribaculaceae bacterium]|nr:thioredoxin [Muribaculaceae bacterium]
MKLKIFKTVLQSILIIILFGSCNGQRNEKLTEVENESSTTGIEVIYFFGKQRCSTCVAMEKFAKEAIDSVFADKTKDGSIIFKSVDINTPEGEKLADLFEVSSSSLFIVDNNPDKPEKVDMTSFGFRNARNHRQEYKQGIIDQINQFLD